MMMFQRLLIAGVLFSVASAAPLTAQSADAAEAEAKNPHTVLIGKLAPSLVFVNAVLQMEASMMGQVRKNEIRISVGGLVVDGSGLIMVASAELDPSTTSETPPGMTLKVTPLELEVQVPGVEEPIKGRIVATDTLLGLTFVKVDKVIEALVPMGFDDVDKPTIGQDLYSVSRLPRGFDYAPYFRTVKVVGQIKKPRKAHVVNDFDLAPGRAFYTLDGKLVGIAAVVQGSGGGAGQGPDRGTFIVSPKVVQASIQQALERAKETDQTGK